MSSNRRRDAARAAPKYLQDFRADEARILAHADRNTSTSRA
jgi:hypothetical protein